MSSESSSWSEKVENGYGTKTSVFSASLIGSASRQKRVQARDPPGAISDAEYMAMSKLMHPSRRDKYFQVYYPTTIAKLQPSTEALATKETAPPEVRKTSREPVPVAEPAYAAYLLKERLQTDDIRRRNHKKSTDCQIQFG